MHLVRTMGIALIAMCVGCSEPSPPESSSVSAFQMLSRPTGKGAFPPELSSFRDAVEKSKLNYISIKAERAIGTPPWTSKFRGQPYLPKGSAYPRDPAGRPLILLVQLNFAEMPPLEGYPSTGILQLFVSGLLSTEQVWGLVQYKEEPFNAERYFASLQDQRFFRVLYHSHPTMDSSKLDSPPAPGYDYVLPIMDEARLTFTKKSEYVSPYDYKFEKVFGKKASNFFSAFGHKEEEIGNRYIDFAHEWAPAKIGGYASFMQGDPRELKPNEDWLLLLEIQSVDASEGVEVMWGDAGVGGLFIRRSDLAKRDFSKVAYYWDNH
jgi:uncharacterized protein YwqG